MRCLVDVHVFLGWMSDPDQLSPAVLSLPRDRSPQIGFSPVSAWELAIESALGKVSGVPLEDLVFVSADRVASRYPVKVFWQAVEPAPLLPCPESGIPDGEIP
jgi:hypothetical protein